MSDFSVPGLLSIQVAGAVALTPLLVGVMRQTRARLEGRAGAGIAQPWRDVRKLLAKEPLQAAASGPLLSAAPLVLITSSLVLCALVPLVGTPTLDRVPDDLFVVVSVLLLGTVALALLGLESGTAFGGMGSSRHMTIAALVEPTVLVAVYALSIPVGTSALSAIVAARVASPSSVVSPVGLLAVVALGIGVVAETGRLPVDNPSTHLELTMIHEAMILEYSGRYLALIEWAHSACKRCWSGWPRSSSSWSLRASWSPLERSSWPSCASFGSPSFWRARSFWRSWRLPPRS